MLNPFAVEQSKKNIGEQIAYIKEKRPYLTSINTINTAENLKADYLCGIDAVGIGDTGKHYNIQFKARNEGNNDFMITCKKLTGQSAKESDLGFIFNNNRYTFDIKAADILVETINGKNYNISKEELSSLERSFKDDLARNITAVRPKKTIRSDGTEFFSGDYYCFISTDALALLRTKVFQSSL